MTQIGSMEEEFEDRASLQYYTATMKVLSRLSNSFNSTSYAAYAWRMFRIYILKPEIILATVIFCLFLLYFNAAEAWSRTFLAGLRNLGKPSLAKMVAASPAERESSEIKKAASVAYSVQGRRPKQEDRFVIDENINNDTGVSFFAIFDGHGGDFASEFAKDILVQNLFNKIIETSNILRGKGQQSPTKCSRPIGEKSDDANDGEQSNNNNGDSGSNLAQRRKSFKKTVSLEDDDRAVPGPLEPSDLIAKLNGLTRPLTKEDFLTPNKAAKTPAKPKQYEAQCYIENNVINFGKMITDEVLAADYTLVEKAKKATNIAGTTALITIVHNQKLVVANVGDSRGVMLDHKGNVIPLSFDHKPQQVREHKRIHDAGGFIAFRGVWRVAGILATSRALGDYPLKDRNLVIADPDVLTFDLKDHKPQFVVLASDGLWDTFNNEEACAFIKDHLHEPHFGAKSIVIQSYNRGSVDNITVIVVVFKDGKLHVGSSAN